VIPRAEPHPRFRTAGPDRWGGERSSPPENALGRPQGSPTMRRGGRTRDCRVLTSRYGRRRSPGARGRFNGGVPRLAGALGDSLASSETTPRWSVEGCALAVHDPASGGPLMSGYRLPLSGLPAPRPPGPPSGPAVWTACEPTAVPPAACQVAGRERRQVGGSHIVIDGRVRTPPAVTATANSG